MEKMILVERGVALYLNQLIDILIEEEYFGFYEDAESYVNKIYDFIYNTSSYTHHKETNKKYARIGQYYVLYKANTQTSWFVFFEKDGNRILVSYIINNHTEEYAIIME